MRDFLKRVLYFGLVGNLTNYLFDNLIITKDNDLLNIKFLFNSWTIILIIGFFCFSFLFVAIIKILSIKINRFIYESYTSLAYIAFLEISAEWIVSLLGSTSEHGNKVLFNIISDFTIIMQLILCMLVIYYFWKYRIEICVGIFIGRILQNFGLATQILSHIFLEKPTNIEKFYFISIVVILFITLTIILRRFNVYDFRSRKDKWLEATGEGPYKVWAKRKLSI